MISSIDHVSLPIREIERSVAFYQVVLSLKQVKRPSFGSVGAWMASGSLEVHLTVYPGHFRPESKVDASDIHFAARVADFDGFLKHIQDLGYSADLPSGHPKQLIIKLNGPAPYKQLYMIDPDNNIIEINDAALRATDAV